MSNSTMRREDYKAVKHMNNAELTAYLKRIWSRGYEAGLSAAQAKAAESDAAAEEAEG